MKHVELKPVGSEVALHATHLRGWVETKDGAELDRLEKDERRFEVDPEGQTDVEVGLSQVEEAERSDPAAACPRHEPHQILIRGRVYQVQFGGVYQVEFRVDVEGRALVGRLTQASEQA